MKLNDAVSGVLIAMFGIAVAAYSRTFPPMPGQNVGPSLFPTLIGCGLTIFGAALAFSRGRERGAPSIAFDEWVGTRAAVLKFALVVAVLWFYAAAVDRLGFFITGFIFLGVLLFAFGVPRKHIVPLSVAVTFVIHYGFYSLLRVPLPWGLLESIAW